MCKYCDFIGFSERLIKEADKYNHQMYVCGAKGRVEEPPSPPYPYKYKQLPIMKNYHGILDDKY